MKTKHLVMTSALILLAAFGVWWFCYARAAVTRSSSNPTSSVGAANVKKNDVSKDAGHCDCARCTGTTVQLPDGRRITPAEMANTPHNLGLIMNPPPLPSIPRSRTATLGETR